VPDRRLRHKKQEFHFVRLKTIVPILFQNILKADKLDFPAMLDKVEQLQLLQDDSYFIHTSFSYSCTVSLKEKALQP
jgi:hypothetical protein